MCTRLPLRSLPAGSMVSTSTNCQLAGNIQVFFGLISSQIFASLLEQSRRIVCSSRTALMPFPEYILSVLTQSCEAGMSLNRTVARNKGKDPRITVPNAGAAAIAVHSGGLLLPVVPGELAESSSSGRLVGQAGDESLNSVLPFRDAR